VVVVVVKNTSGLYMACALKREIISLFPVIAEVIL
jgi:hypothetical protein